MPAYVGNPLAGDPIWEASSASELRIAITTKQVSRAGHPSELLVATNATGEIAGRRRRWRASCCPWFELDFEADGRGLDPGLARAGMAVLRELARTADRQV